MTTMNSTSTSGGIRIEGMRKVYGLYLIHI